MTDTTYVSFQGLDAPVALTAADALLPLIADVFQRWPYRVASTAAAAPFVTITPSDDDKWQLRTAMAPDAPRTWDAVNVVCDLVAEMAWARVRSDPAALCVHAAAVAFGDRLVLFPNARRAGKSTLALMLAHIGHPLFSDDFLPVVADPETQAFQGISSGIAPRMRLPVPDDFSAGIHNWVASDPGPANRQYKYLLNGGVADNGASLPIGAIVVLMRSDTPVAPALTDIDRADALTSIISQNFAREVHAGAILKSAETLTDALPCYQLTYFCAEEAAAYLSTHDALKALPLATRLDPGTSATAIADRPAVAFHPDVAYVCAPGLTETETSDGTFLADSSGVGIYRLNAGSTAIWRLLQEPIDMAEVIAVLSAAFADVPESQIAADAERLMRDLAAAGLIAPATEQLAAE